MQWTLRHDGKVVQKHTSSRCRPPSITLFNFEDRLEPGSYTLTADVTTDWQQTGTDTFSFNATPDVTSDSQQAFSSDTPHAMAPTEPA
ncbi:hypothetical protein ACR6C2_35945 [Streptomyces sp. INA 01156]